ncbi:DUF6817 domain-containing protein [Streptomyces sp. NPDC056160]|uniref:DUF6817 domain-containing protein n=1 Tax=Streptomyces sp. NPDC056160 TaxID=3345731 RepID=UPI0035DD863F
MSEILNEPASVDRPAVVQYLRSRGAESMPHPGGTLLEHLLRVSHRLAAWGADADVQLAGMCHAAYGTDGFAESLVDLSDRAVLAGLIGERPEALVYLYGSCERAVTYPRLHTSPSPAFRDRFTQRDVDPRTEDVRAFLEITAANELDVFEHDEDLAARYGPWLYRLMQSVRDLVSPEAWNAVHLRLGDCPPDA